MSFFEVLSKAPATDLTICVGIDPTPDTLSAWGLEDTADGARQFALVMLEAAENTVAVVKPQIAYFERFGAVGYAALTDVISEARQTSLMVIADASSRISVSGDHPGLTLLSDRGKHPAGHATP